MSAQTPTATYNSPIERFIPYAHSCELRRRTVDRRHRAGFPGRHEPCDRRGACARTALEPIRTVAPRRNPLRPLCRIGAHIHRHRADSSMRLREKFRSRIDELALSVSA